MKEVKESKNSKGKKAKFKKPNSKIFKNSKPI